MPTTSVDYGQAFNVVSALQRSNTPPLQCSITPNGSARFSAQQNVGLFQARVSAFALGCPEPRPTSTPILDNHVNAQLW